MHWNNKKSHQNYLKKVEWLMKQFFSSSHSYYKAEKNGNLFLVKFHIKSTRISTFLNVYLLQKKKFLIILLSLFQQNWKSFHHFKPFKIRSESLLIFFAVNQIKINFLIKKMLFARRKITYKCDFFKFKKIIKLKYFLGRFLVFNWHVFRTFYLSQKIISNINLIIWKIHT